MNNNSSTNLTRYVPEVKEQFRRYLAKDLDENELVSYLRKLERKARKELVPRRGKNENIWFRFFEGDPGATTIPNIERTLNKMDGRANYHYMLECMELAISAQNNPEVYFS